MNHTAGRFHHRGVSLMELMVVMVVVSILAAIAIPSYRQYVIRVNRTDATRELLSLAQRLERCFTRTNDYQLLDNAPTPCLTLPQNTPGGTYTVTGVINANNFVLTATPQAGQAADADCGNFTLNQLSQQGISGTGSAQGCWGGRRN